MKVNIDINEKYDQLSITIQAKEWTKELEEIVRKLQGESSRRIIGIDEEQSILLSPEEIEFVYAKDRKVFAIINKQAIELSMRLYEIEELLKNHGFTRFSKSVVGNINKIVRFELSFNGNLCVYFQSGNKEYVSRKYVQEIKKKLILGVD
ncbi:LytTR family transcriptional regulator DNA-binding domain-containing protein [Alkalihalobacillus sp. MEB130]|uniref:LytTR family DNA-binding domain-containing protein n=1 Tax=Alkalihalobacillus sp. MEB130 TaxID=2976704 RepID=UPI0028DD8366|nr:LytTR family DNA-binding domain-containing protein [Alkalihalobacillus sp. MEB130]MDT8860139.1 LytTR family transcriptional regulator DNA-binding domain-containing protein [Alkalihalobacillus sp. MEB130]